MGQIHCSRCWDSKCNRVSSSAFLADYAVSQDDYVVRGGTLFAICPHGGLADSNVFIRRAITPLLLDSGIKYDHWDAIIRDVTDYIHQQIRGTRE